MRSGEYRFEVVSDTANSVKLYAKSLTDNSSLFLGNAYKGTTLTTWRYRWQPTGNILGDYEIVAYAFLGTESVATNIVQITIPPLVSGVQATASPSIGSTTEIKTLQPTVSFTFSKPLPLQDTVALQLDVAHASSVQMYALGSASLIKKYLGYAVPLDTDTWLLQFDSTQLPDGVYTFSALINNAYGMYESRKSSVTVKNSVAVVLTPVQQTTIKNLETVDIKASTSIVAAPSPVIRTKTQSITSTTSNLDTVAPVDITNVKDALKIATDPELVRLAAAMRMNDTGQIAVIKQRIQNLKMQMSSKLGIVLSSEQSAELDTAERVAAHFD